jgi:UDP-glucose 4-epimerase
VFNVGADMPYTVNVLARKTATAMGVPAKVKYLDERNEVKHVAGNHSRLHEVFGYQARFSLEAGLERMARWARSVGPRHSKPFEHVEIEKNMPKSWQDELLLARLRVGT